MVLGSVLNLSHNHHHHIRHRSQLSVSSTKKKKKNLSDNSRSLFATQLEVAQSEGAHCEVCLHLKVKVVINIVMKVKVVINIAMKVKVVMNIAMNVKVVINIAMNVKVVNDHWSCLKKKTVRGWRGHGSKSESGRKHESENCH